MISASFIGRFLRSVFAGDAAALSQHLIRDSKLSADELAELKRAIEERER
jgi:predicted transcriptional regulator